IPPFPIVSNAPPATSAAAQARRLARRRGESAKRKPPASRNRTDDIRNGGIVRIASMIPRYVEPQTTYSVASAPQARAVTGVLPATDSAAIVEPPRVGAVAQRDGSDQDEQE